MTTPKKILKFYIHLNLIIDSNTYSYITDSENKNYKVSIKTNKDYIIYTDNSYDENKNLNIFASIYYPFDLEKSLENIESCEEWEEVEKFLENASGDLNG